MAYNGSSFPNQPIVEPLDHLSKDDVQFSWINAERRKPTLTQANLRILLKILESEVQSPYGVRFGLDLARALHGLNPRERIGYVFYGGQSFWCRFRPTLSMPKGLESWEEIREHVKSEKAIEAFNKQFEKIEIKAEGKEVSRKEFDENELKVLEALKEFKRKGIPHSLTYNSHKPYNQLPCTSLPLEQISD